MALDLEHIKLNKRDPIEVHVPEWGGSVEAKVVTVGEFHEFRRWAENKIGLTSEEQTLELCVFLISKPSLDSDAGREVLRGMTVKGYTKLQEDLLSACGLNLEEEKKS